MQIEQESQMQKDRALDYMQVQRKVLIVQVYVFETFKAVDKEVYKMLFGSEGKFVNGSMVEISPAQLGQVEANPGYEIQYIDMQKEEYNEIAKSNPDNILPSEEPSNIYNEDKKAQEEMLNMMEELKTEAIPDETMLKK